MFAGASALSAFLLFWMQPLVARLVLPLFGGSPQVWTTSLVFFQSVLLGGYLIAHRLVQLRPRTQVAVQLALLVAGGAGLPFGLGRDAPSAEGHGVGAVLWLLASMVGLPALALCVHAPLLQRWFARAAPGRDPYPLYSASNAGSLVALAAFPFVLEPRLGISIQSNWWLIAYGTLIVFIATCGVLLLRASPSAAPASSPQAASPLGWGQRLRWMALAGVTTSLLSGVTAHLATDVASIPLLWIVPLAIYLLTYIVAFSGNALHIGPRRLMLGAQAVALALLVATAPADSVQASLFVDLSAFGLTALLCHGELARLRPAPERLTDFYLAISIGGVLGGAFNALLAPLVFSSVAEYPIALVAAAALRPVARSPEVTSPRAPKKVLLELMGPLAIGGVAAVVLRIQGPDTEILHAQVWKWLVFLLGAASLLFARKKLAYPLSLALALGFSAWAHPEGTVLARSRTFFGVHRVAIEGGFHWLHDGTTVHGVQNWEPAHRREPQAYYVKDGPLGQVFASLAARSAGKRIGAIGLGAGTVACHLREDQELTVFEIDPSVVAIARDPHLFTFLSDCKPGARIVVGDARLSLLREPLAVFDAIILDAFSSDSIPVHLLTQEAIGVYLSRLAPGGLLVFHTSNRFLRLEDVIGGIASAEGLVARRQRFVPSKALDDNPDFLAFTSEWVIAGRKLEDLGSLARDARWIGTPAGRKWTDDHADVVSAMDFSK